MRGRISDAIDGLAEDPMRGDLKKLAGEAGEWRLRVGSYRIRFRIDRTRGAAVVLRVLPRDEAYRD